MRQPALAESLRTLAEEGADALYGGALGQTVAHGIRQRGGILTIDDLRAYRTIQRQPLTAAYRGHEITLPPPFPTRGPPPFKKTTPPTDTEQYVIVWSK